MRVMTIRSAVYMAEQECPYDEEFDGNDFSATHLIGYVGDEPAGCLRIRYFADFAKSSVLRFAANSARRALAFQLVRAGIELCRAKGYRRIYGHAQKRLLNFWAGSASARSKAAGNLFLRLRLRRDRARHDAASQAISIGVDPYVMIRPEGRWHVPGILERSAIRPVTRPSVDEAAGKGPRMSSVIDLRAYVNPSVIQTLVLVDLQQEYIASPRVLALEETKGALANCRAALAHARAMGLPVAFARWIDRTPLFNKATRVLALDRGLRAARRRHDLRAQPAVLLRQRRFRRGDERRRRQLRARGFRRRGRVPRDRDRRVPSWSYRHLSGRCFGEPCARRYRGERRASRRLGRRGAVRRRDHDAELDRADITQEQLERAGRWKRAWPNGLSRPSRR